MIFGHHGGTHASAHGIFDNAVVSGLAKKNADTRVFIAAFHIPIQGFQIEFQLTDVLRLEVASLQLDGYQTLQAPVIKQQIDLKGRATHLQRVFAIYK